MSLNEQSAKFAKSMAAAHTAQRRVVANPAPTSDPVPNGTPKRKRPIIAQSKPSTTPVVYSQPADTSLIGQHMATQVFHVIAHLKAKETTQTIDEIFSYLSIPKNPALISVIRANPRVLYDPVNDTYEFRPTHNIRSDTSLLAYLQQQTTAQGLQVKELKEGWTAAVDVISQLEADREILVTRTKKDNQPRMVWINDKTLDSDVDNEFKEIWHRVKIPPPAELPGELTKLGTKPTSVDPASIKKDVKPQQKGRKKASNRRIKISNTHMSGILKDTKDLRK